MFKAIKEFLFGKPEVEPKAETVVPVAPYKVEKPEPFTPPPRAADVPEIKPVRESSPTVVAKQVKAETKMQPAGKRAAIKKAVTKKPVAKKPAARKPAAPKKPVQ